MKRTIQIKVNGIEFEAIPNNSRTAQAIWEALPIVTHINTWGDEVYFAIPVKLELEKSQDTVKGSPVVGGGIMFRGRAVEKLINGLPTRSWRDFTECPHEDLENPKRVHLDSYGNVHLCQGLSMGNMWQTPLSGLINNYDCDSHPICKLLVKGGPALLAQEYGGKHDDEYVDACHLCYDLRLKLLDRFPEYLAPRQVYGL